MVKGTDDLGTSLTLRLDAMVITTHPQHISSGAHAGPEVNEVPHMGLCVSVALMGTQREPASQLCSHQEMAETLESFERLLFLSSASISQSLLLQGAHH